MALWAIFPELVLAAASLALVPLAGWAKGRWRELPWLAAAAAFAVAIAFTARMLPWEPASVFGRTYAVDGFGTAFKLLLETGGLTTLVLLRGYFGREEPAVHGPVALLLATLGGMGLASALDLALIVLFLQMLSLASYLLVALMRRDPFANEATLKYFIYAAAALAVMAYGLTFVFGLTGSLQLEDIGRALAHADRAWIAVALGLVLVGYAFEATLVPFHFWAPDVYEGATAPIAGFLSVVPKIAAFAGLMRFLASALPDATAAAWPALAALLAVLTMTLGNLAALRQTRLKRLLAYSSIAQAGYVLLAVAVLGRAPGAAGAAGYYLAAYLFMNLGAFGVAAQLERAAGSDAIDAVRGLGRSAPWPGAVLALSLLSLAGIPPLAGFLGKVLLLKAAMAGGFAWLAVLAAANMAIGLYYYIAVVARIYFSEPAGGTPCRGGWAFNLPFALCVAGMLLLGIVPAPFLRTAGLLEQVALQVLE